MVDKKYVVCPDYVISSDGDVHRISASQLIHLYGVNPAECIISLHDDDLRGRDISGLIFLYPQRSGDYSLPMETP